MFPWTCLPNILGVAVVSGCTSVTRVVTCLWQKQCSQQLASPGMLLGTGKLQNTFLVFSARENTRTTGLSRMSGDATALAGIRSSTWPACSMRCLNPADVLHCLHML